MQKRLHQRGSIEGVAIICLVLALVTALGWIFWQNFVHKEEAKKETDLVVVDKKNEVSAEEGSKSVSEKADTAAKKYKLNLADVQKALPDGCSLGSTDKKYVQTLAAGTATGALVMADVDANIFYARTNAAQTWIYISGGCGSQAFGFILHRNKNTDVWSLIHRSWSYIPICSEVNGKGIPSEVAYRCLDDNDGESLIR